MRIRTIKPEFWHHEGLCSLSEFARLMAIALLNWADDEGYFFANPTLIRGQLFPFQDSSKMIPGCLQDLSRVGWIKLGKDNQGRSVGKIVNFEKHQRVDKPKSSSIKASSQFQDESKNDLGSIQDASMLEGKGREGNKEGKGMSEAEEFQAEWNQSGFQKIAAISAGRSKSIGARFSESFFQANWKEGIARAAKSDFCNGKNDRNWKADPDWFLRPDTLPKILEGKYDNKTATQTVMIIE